MEQLVLLALVMVEHVLLVAVKLGEQAERAERAERLQRALPRRLLLELRRVVADHVDRFFRLAHRFQPRLADFEQRNGAEMLAIPHNGNLSNGRMFTVETFETTLSPFLK